MSFRDVEIQKHREAMAEGAIRAHVASRSGDHGLGLTRDHARASLDKATVVFRMARAPVRLRVPREGKQNRRLRQPRFPSSGRKVTQSKLREPARNCNGTFAGDSS
jgi:hypothetical protein